MCLICLIRLVTNLQFFATYGWRNRPMKKGRAMTQRLVGIDENGLRVGEDHQRATLTDGDVELMRELHAEGIGYTRLAKMFDVTRCHVRDIVKFRKRATAPVAWRKVG
jgi:hypothetical protein